MALLKSDFTLNLLQMQPMLQAYSKRFTIDPDDSFDLMQDTLLRALRYRDKFKEGTNLGGWLFTIMRNTFFNQYRRNVRFKKVSINKDHSVLCVEEPYTLKRPDLNLEYDDICRKIRDVREELLTPFSMYTTGYKYHEIATSLKIPIGTVKNRIFNARKEIQARISEDNVKLHG